MMGATYPALYGILGYPLGHSLSPRMHSAALEAAGLPGTYVALPVPAERLEGAITGVRAWHLPGLSVTIPHKVAVMAYLDEVTPLAKRIGAVNTLYWDHDKLVGDNTDYHGFRVSLPKVPLAGRVATVLGVGGAARAAVLALKDEGMAKIHLVARRTAAAEALRAELLEGCAGEVVAFDDMPLLEPLLGQTALVVNATPVGLHGPASPLSAAQLAWLPADAHVMDLIYKPARTPLLQLAEARGLGVTNGFEMLLQQAVKAFERWTGMLPPVEVMRSALQAGLDAE